MCKRLQTTINRKTHSAWKILSTIEFAFEGVWGARCVLWVPNSPYSVRMLVASIVGQNANAFNAKRKIEQHSVCSRTSRVLTQVVHFEYGDAIQPFSQPGRPDISVCNRAKIAPLFRSDPFCFEIKSEEIMDYALP